MTIYFEWGLGIGDWGFGGVGFGGEDQKPKTKHQNHKPKKK